MDFTLVTSSDAKAEEASRILGFSIERRNLELGEIQSLDVGAVARHKAESAYAALDRRPVIAEDTGLYLTAWRGLPGPLIRWFEVTVGVRGILDMLSGFDDRTAVARTAVAACDGRTTCFVGELRGRIATSVRGEGGFGWDTIFVPEGHDRTLAEMTPSEKDAISMRRFALESFAHSLRR